MVTGSVHTLEEPVMRDRRDGVDLFRKWLRWFTGVGGILDETVGPAFGEDSVNTALHDGIDDATRHRLRIRNDDTAKADVDDLLLLLVRSGEELDEVGRRKPFLRTDVGIVEEPVA